MDNIKKAIEKKKKIGPCSNIFKFKKSTNLLDNVVIKQVGREIIIGKKHLIDFASCNYLGLDYNPKMLSSVHKIIKEWGVHPSWSRIVASPILYERLEDKIAELIGIKHTLVFPTITLINFGILRSLSGPNTLILIDNLAHKTIYDGALLSKTSGAEVINFRHNDVEQIKSILEKYIDKEVKLICVDGVYSLSGNFASLKELQFIANKFGAILYVDDAHGFGVIGERDEGINYSFGRRGNGIIRHLGLDYKNILYVSGLSKAFSSFGAFITCQSEEIKDFFKSFATPYSHSGPIPYTSLAISLKALEINDTEGDTLRKKLYEYAHRVREYIENIGLETSNNNNFPIISIIVGDSQITKDAYYYLFKNGILTTLGIYPYAPRNAGIIRFTITALHTEKQMNKLLKELKLLKKFLDTRK